MTYPILLTIVAAVAFAATGARASCAAPPTASIEMNVREAPLIVVQDIPLENLRAVADRLPQRPAHPILGFYAGTIGYALRDFEMTPDGSICPGFRLRADLVAVDRRIAVASDLVRFPCRFNAAFAHYRRHAAAASLALHRLAEELPATLKPEIGQYIESRQPTADAARRYAALLLGAAVDRLSVSLREAQRHVDSDNEIQRLAALCGAI